MSLFLLSFRSTFLIGSLPAQVQSSVWQSCLTDWTDAGPTLSIGGTSLTVVKCGAAVEQVTQPVPSYVWVIICVVVMGIAIAIVLALVIFFTRRRNKKPK